MAITIPNPEIITPAFAVPVFSVFRLYIPSTTPTRLTIPPQAGMIARHRLINPNAAEARARNLAVRNSGSRLAGSVSN